LLPLWLYLPIVFALGLAIGYILGWIAFLIARKVNFRLAMLVISMIGWGVTGYFWNTP